MKNRIITTLLVIVCVLSLAACSGASETVTVPAELDGHAVTAIGENAFYGCKALNGIYIPNGSRDKFEKLLPKHLHDKLKELN